MSAESRYHFTHYYESLPDSGSLPTQTILGQFEKLSNELAMSAELGWRGVFRDTSPPRLQDFPDRAR